MSNILNSLSLAINGGKGSGNFGHAGRPGMIGGSGDGVGGSSKESKSAKSSDKSAKGSGKSSKSFDKDPSKTDKTRTKVPKGDLLGDKIKDIDGLNYNAENDCVYANKEFMRNDDINNRTYGWGQVEFGTDKSLTKRFTIHEKNGKIQITSGGAYDDANYHWASTTDGENYIIYRDGKEEGSYRAAAARRLRSKADVVIPVSVLNELARLDKEKGLKPKKAIY